MKKIINNKKNLILIILILIIISGIITFVVSGFNKSIDFSAGTRIEIYLGNGYDKQEVINIAQESFPDRKIEVYEIEKLNQIAGIKLNDYTEEELDNFKSKISEKYQIDEEELELYEVDIPEVRIKTVIKPYIMPLGLTTVLGLIYIGIRNIKKANVINAMLQTILILFLTLGLYFSLILLFRLSFGMYTMPIALTIYVITLLLNANKINKII